MSFHTTIVRTAAAAIVLVASGCGVTAFSPSFPDNQLDAVKAAMTPVKTRDAGPTNADGKSLAFILAAEPDRIVCYDIKSQTVLWEEAATPSSRIIVGRNYIFYRTGKDGLAARHIRDGGRAWQVALDTRGRLLGMSADGDDLYYAVETTGVRGKDGAAAYLIAVKGSSGGTRWVQPSRGRIGAPAARNGRVFVPLRSQSIAILDGTNGVELARVRSKDEALLWARSVASGVLFGGKTGVYRLDDKAIAGTKKESTFATAKLPDSVRPVYWWNGYNAALSGYTAYDRNRLLWRLADGDDMTFADDTIYVHNYRFFFSFRAGGSEDGKKSPLRWAYSYPRHDVIGSTHTGSALAMVTDHGEVLVLDPATGVPMTRKALSMKVKGVTFDADGYAPAAGATAKSSLREALLAMVWDVDRRFGQIKLFAVEQLAKLPGDDISADLVKIVTKLGIDRNVYKRAGEMIVGRRDQKAVPLYLDTLRSEYSYVDATRAKAVDIMARALGDLKVKKAVRPLIKHLHDHETPVSAIEAIVEALALIGGKPILEPFRNFLLTYRCDPAFAKAPRALNLAADVLSKQGNEELRQVLSFVANDDHTVKTLRTYLNAALRKSTGPDKKGTPPATKAEPKAKTASAASPAATETKN